VAEKKGSWQTTTCGVLGIVAVFCGVGIALLDGDPATNPDWTLVIAAVVAGVAAIRARDDDKSSEDVGAK